jgi:L-alanine-DL-glutamate epimerase-like enolase superfamily enzyme
MIGSIRVARMVELRQMPTTVHISGGFGFVYMVHFASCVQRIGDWQEYKEGVETYGKWFDPPVRIIDGVITVPRGPGVGLADPKEVLNGAQEFPA